MRIRPVETSGLPMPFQRRGQGPVIVGSPDPLAWANKADGAKHAWDFIANAARWNGQYIGALANTPNWTFTRASTGYAQTSGGVLVPFASGELRRTDKGVLIEGAGTNLCLQSQTFDNAKWAKTRCSITADAAVAPDGTTTADKLVEDSTAGNTHNAAQSFSGLTDSTTYCLTIYAKAAERTWCYLQVTDKAGSAHYSYINLATGALGTTTAGLTAVSVTALADGWYRWGVTFSSSTGATTPIIVFGPASGDNGRIYNGDGTSGIYLWGAQLE